MIKHEIEVLIAPDGSVKLDIKGIKGSACSPIVKKFADAVGTLESQDFTSEYYEKTSQQTQRKQGA